MSKAEWIFRSVEVGIIGLFGLYLGIVQTNLTGTQNKLLEAQNQLLAGQNKLLESANAIASAQKALSDSISQKDEPVRLWVEGERDGKLRLRNDSRVPLTSIEILSVEGFYSYATKKFIGGTTVGSPSQPAETIRSLGPLSSTPIKRKLLGTAKGPGPIAAALRLQISVANARTLERKGPFYFVFKVDAHGKLIPSFALGERKGDQFEWSDGRDKELFGAFAQQLRHYESLYGEAAAIFNFDAPFWGVGLEVAVKGPVRP